MTSEEGDECQVFNESLIKLHLLINIIFKYYFSPGTIKTPIQAKLGIKEDQKEEVRRSLLCHFLYCVLCELELHH